MSDPKRVIKPDDEEKAREEEEFARVKAKKKAEKERQEQKEQIAQILAVTSHYSLLSRLWSFASGIIKITGHSVGVASQIIPPINAVISGISSVIDAVEAIFLSTETRNRRVVKATNGLLSTGLGIASLVLAFNPTTAPLGMALSVGAMAISTAKEAYFWNKARKDLSKAKTELTKAKLEMDMMIHTFLSKEHHEKINRVKEINKKINLIENQQQSLSDKVASLALLHHEKDAIFHAINYSVNGNSEIILARNKVQWLKSNVIQARIQRNEKRKSFFNSAISLIGASLLVVAAFAAVGAVIANPITLSIIGISLLGAVTTVAVATKVKEKIFPAKPKEIPTPKIKPVSSSHPSETIELTHKHTAHLHDTIEIVHQMAARSHLSEKQFLEADIKAYREPVPRPVAPAKKILLEENIKDKKLEKDDDSDTFHPH